jgi:hypothetical protein
MNASMTASSENGLWSALREYRAVCQETLALYREEQQLLQNGQEYPAFLFYRRRKDLLPRLEKALIEIRRWRGQIQSGDPAVPVPGTELRALTDEIQTMLMRILQLDRDNRQALLGRGLLPAEHLPKPAAQQPHYVANLYRRHSAA